ncbi:hypothetical protein [Pedobacter glucosidilyticus]|uniref:hypothetical protein n=1 Tax=Pedobacter glucosidilyticus TaxID=1122941 RepID=UPI0026F0F0BD|nr:hypothetical protein [Pedobacter glucosidilyticus]
MSHTFHIPVLGLAYSVDTPLKVGRYGISSVVSIVDDHLIERMRAYHAKQNQENYIPIQDNEPHFRAKRITAYLNLMQDLLDKQFEALKQQAFEPGTDLTRYFDLQPDHSALKKTYLQMLNIQDEEIKAIVQKQLKDNMQKGAIDVNIMAKVDKINSPIHGEEQLSDALASLQGFAESKLNAGVVLSAGMNPRLYAHLENFKDFYPNENHLIKKTIILKVSDFRSALIQAKFLAKKGLWVSEFRIESGLNCGGHAFATEGYLLGPILEEFKVKRQEMLAELAGMYKNALLTKGYTGDIETPRMKISVQGGIGTAAEDNFLLKHYELDATGWGSPFLLVPEATNVDEETLNNLAEATREDFYISGSSPLGVPFNNFRKTTAEKLRLERIAKGKPGSPCTKKYLVSNTEFTKEPICTASRKYQNLKIKSLQNSGLDEQDLQTKINEVTEKICLCEGLVTSAYLKNDMIKSKESKAVTICPGPNIAYFSGKFSLDEMVKHIYGKINLLAGTERSNMFINELNLYIEHLKKDISMSWQDLSDKKVKYYTKFRAQLEQGIHYYKQLIPEIQNQTDMYKNKMLKELQEAEEKLKMMIFATENT